MNKKYSVSRKDQIYFTQRLSFLLGAGLGLKESLSILYSQQTRRKNIKFLLKNFVSDISSGIRLSEGIQNHTNSFEPMSVALIKIGEECGTLAQNLEYISKELVQKNILRHKFISALIYPIFIAFATTALSFFLIGYIFPKIRPLFTSMNIPLPWTTRLLIFMSDFVSENWTVILVALVFIICVSIVIFRLRFIKNLLEDFALKVVILRASIRHYWAATTMRYLHLLLAGNVPIDTSLLLISESIKYSTYSRVFRNISLKITDGTSLSNQFNSYPHLFPRLISDMVAIGEASGTLIESSEYLSKIFTQEIDEAIKTITSLLEPLLMLSMGFIVGFIALSIITPLYAITSNIHT